MLNKANAQLFDTLLDHATQIARESGHTVLEPFHMLVALVRDGDARKFLEKLEFPFEQLQQNVEGLASDYKAFPFDPAGKHLEGILHTETIRHMRAMAQNTAAGFERDYVGYTEILNAITNLGDDDSRGCLSCHNLGLDDNIAIMQMMLDEKAAWQPSRRKNAEANVRETFQNAANDNADVLHMDKIMAERIIGQTAAIKALHTSIKNARAGLQEPNKPLGSYLFAGPTGVGKTEVAKQLAETLNMKLLRFDMSEYMEDFTVTNLIGSPAGYLGHDKGGLLTNAVDENPHCVLLLDEIEKAHPDVYNILLQVMDDGRLTDSHGKTIDFTNVILVMTSNAGALDISQPKKQFGFGGKDTESNHASDQKASYDAAIKSTFRPEFRNRLDDIITFEHLTRDQITQIARIFIDEMNDLPAAHKLNLDFYATDEAIDALVEKGYDKAMGARPLKRIIKNDIKPMLSNMILEGRLKDDEVIISYSADDDAFWIDARPLPGNTPKREADNNAAQYGAQYGALSL